MASYQATVLADGAQSLWPHGEASGTVATDVGPAASNGTYTNTTGITYGVSAPIGIQPTTAINYEPLVNNGYMSAPAVALNSPVDVFTLEIWLLRHSTGFSGSPFSARHGTVGATGAPAITFTAGNVFQIGGGGGAFVIAGSTITIADTTTWHHIVWTKNGATNVLYIDGVNRTGTVTNQTFTAFTAGALWVVNGDGGSALPAQVADVSVSMPAVYTAALSAAKVLNHYQIGTNTLPPLVSGGLRRHLSQK